MQYVITFFFLKDHVFSFFTLIDSSHYSVHKSIKA